MQLGPKDYPWVCQFRKSTSPLKVQLNQLLTVLPPRCVSCMEGLLAWLLQSHTWLPLASVNESSLDVIPSISLQNLLEEGGILLDYWQARLSRSRYCLSNSRFKLSPGPLAWETNFRIMFSEVMNGGLMGWRCSSIRETKKQWGQLRTQSRVDL